MRNGNKEIRNGNEEMRLNMGNIVHTLHSGSYTYIASRT